VLGIWSSIGGAGATAALLIGGPLVDGLGWEWIFFINVPVAGAVLAFSPVLLRESRGETARRTYDAAGGLTITAALVLLVYAVVEAPDAGWGSGRTLGLLAGSVLLVALFARVERRSAAPLAPLRIFHSRMLVGGNVVMLALGMLAFGTGLIVSLDAQQVLGYTAIEFGLGTVVLTVGAVAGSIVGQGLATRVGVRAVAAAGVVLTGVGCLLLTGVSPHGGYWSDIFPGLLVFGPGLGATYVAASIATLAGVAEQESGLASALSNAAFQIGGALGSAVMTTIAVTYADGPDPLSALTEGFSSAFAAALVFAAIGLVSALVLLGGRRAAAQGEPAPAPL
jgi:MFS family permease